MASEAVSVETLGEALERESKVNPVLPLELAVRSAEGSRKREVIADRKQRTRNALMGLPIDKPKGRAPDLPDHLYQPRAVGRR